MFKFWIEWQVCWMIHKSQDCHYRTVFVRAPTEQIWQKSFQTGASSLDLPLYIIFLHRLCCSLCWLPNSPSVEANWPLVPLGLYSISLAAPVEKEFLLIATALAMLTSLPEEEGQRFQGPGALPADPWWQWRAQWLQTPVRTQVDLDLELITSSLWVSVSPSIKWAQ